MEKDISQNVKKKNKKTNLTLPQPVGVERSPLSSPYFQKLAQLSPRSFKMADPNRSPSRNYLKKTNPGDVFDQGFSCSTGSTSSSVGSEFMAVAGDSGNVFNFQQSSAEIENNEESDIEFFLQVCNVFNDYLDDKIASLEQRYANNQKILLSLQKAKKNAEEQASNEENQLSRDVSNLVSALHQRQMELKSIIQKKNQDVLKKYREEEDRCRKNTKKISELLSFAKQHRSVSGGSLKESLMQEFKERLSLIENLSFEEFHQADQTSRIDLQMARSCLSSLQLSTNNQDRSSSIIILARQLNDQFTTSSIVVRWQCLINKPCVINWKYTTKGKLIEKEMDGLKESKHVINDLPSNCDVIVKLRYTGENNVWSRIAKFRTLEAPASFIFDSSTAHIKLKLSPDKKTVCYGGDATASPKSPSRFSFALNVLGSRPFFLGKHYWEVQVNGNGWACGVAYQGVPRNSWLGSNSESWILHHNPRKFEYKVRHGGEAHEIDPKLSNPRDYLKQIGIFLDMEEGTITFIDPVQERVLFTYLEDRFTEPVCAAVNPFYHGESLTLRTGLNVPNYLLNKF